MLHHRNSPFAITRQNCTRGHGSVYNQSKLSPFSQQKCINTCWSCHHTSWMQKVMVCLSRLTMGEHFVRKRAERRVKWFIADTVLYNVGTQCPSLSIHKLTKKQQRKNLIWHGLCSDTGITHTTSEHKLAIKPSTYHTLEVLGNSNNPSTTKFLYDLEYTRIQTDLPENLKDLDIKWWVQWTL